MSENNQVSNDESNNNNSSTSSSHSSKLSEADDAQLKTFTEDISKIIANKKLVMIEARKAITQTIITHLQQYRTRNSKDDKFTNDDVTYFQSLLRNKAKEVEQTIVEKALQDFKSLLTQLEQLINETLTITNNFEKETKIPYNTLVNSYYYLQKIAYDYFSNWLSIITTNVKDFICTDDNDKYLKMIMKLFAHPEQDIRGLSVSSIWNFCELPKYESIVVFNCKLCDHLPLLASFTDIRTKQVTYGILQTVLSFPQIGGSIIEYNMLKGAFDIFDKLTMSSVVLTIVLLLVSNKMLLQKMIASNHWKNELLPAAAKKCLELIQQVHYEDPSEFKRSTGLQTIYTIACASYFCSFSQNNTLRLYTDAEVKIVTDKLEYIVNTLPVKQLMKVIKSSTYSDHSCYSSMLLSSCPSVRLLGAWKMAAFANHPSQYENFIPIVKQHITMFKWITPKSNPKMTELEQLITTGIEESIESILQVEELSHKHQSLRKSFVPSLQQICIFTIRTNKSRVNLPPNLDWEQVITLLPPVLSAVQFDELQYFPTAAEETIDATKTQGKDEEIPQ